MLHINLSRKNDLIVVCPATANIIAKFANGYADDLASTSLIAANKQIVIVASPCGQKWLKGTNTGFKQQFDEFWERERESPGRPGSLSQINQTAA